MGRASSSASRTSASNPWRVRPEVDGQHDRPLASNQASRDVAQRVRIACAQPGWWRLARGGLLHVTDLGHQDFTRQRQVHGSRRIARGDLKCAGDDLAHLLGASKLVVPLHEVADDAVLVELFLEPVDIGVARAAQARVRRIGRAAGGNQDRRASALRVVQHPAEVLRPDVDVNEHGLRPSGGLVIAVRGGERDELEETEHGSRDGLSHLFEFRKGFLDGNRVGARVHEQALDTVRHQRANVGFGGFSRPRLGRLSRRGLLVE